MCKSVVQTKTEQFIKTPGTILVKVTRYIVKVTRNIVKVTMKKHDQGLYTL